MLRRSARPRRRVHPAPQREAEQDRKQEHLQDIPVRQRADDAFGNEVKDEIDGSCGLVQFHTVGKFRGIGLGGKATADLEQTAHNQAEHQGKSGDVFETDKRFNADRADFLIWAIPDTTVQKMIGASTLL